MLSEQAFMDAANELGVEVATIKAVAEVESSGSGFLPSGEPKILFEPHIFWKELRKRNINPKDYLPFNEDILYPVWGTRPYGKVSEQHGRLQKAVRINNEAALRSASWGKIQIMGFNHVQCGFNLLQSFINAMYKDEDSHLLAFTNYIIATHLDDELREKDWAGFARGYNGASYHKNKYDTKLALAYAKFSQ
jgi:hypothetical protein